MKLSCLITSTPAQTSYLVLFYSVVRFWDFHFKMNANYLYSYDRLIVIITIDLYHNKKGKICWKKITRPFWITYHCPESFPTEWRSTESFSSDKTGLLQPCTLFTTFFSVSQQSQWGPWAAWKLHGERNSGLFLSAESIRATWEQHRCVSFQLLLFLQVQDIIKTQPST